ncbi:MAG TPA: NAD(P)/FAD-dependent oxidoreductase [Acidimicrobiales bacterium]
MSTATTPDDRHHVVIIGAGFGGLFAAKALRRTQVRVTLIDRTNHHLFQPLLYQVATGILSEGQIAPASRDIFRNYASMEIVLAEVQAIDPEAQRIELFEFGETTSVSYDSLIVAAGATTSYFGHNEYRPHASGMKSLNDALHLRGQIFGAFERAEAEEDDEARRAFMTFVVVGGGPTGVEMAGQLKELSRRALRSNYRRIDPSSSRVILVEGGDQLVSAMGDHLAKVTLKDMGRLGVEVHLGAMVTGMDETMVEITKKDGTTVKVEAATRVWAAGTKGAPLGAQLAQATGATVDKSGRVEVEPDCTVPGYPDIFVVGDLMALDHLPGVAEVAMQAGAHAAHTIHRRLKGNSVRRPFTYRDLGTMAAISRFRAVAKIGPVKVGGFIGWLLWLVVHVTFLTGFKNRFGALARWVVSFIGRGRYERALTGRWTTGQDPSAESS